MAQEITGSSVEQGYLTDVAYVRTYVPDLAPGGLRLVAAINGFPQPKARDFDYCELGFGSGDTLVTLAAATPDSRFVGVDLLPDHVAAAGRLAAQGSVGNVRLLERDFADLAGEDLPAFDYVTAHGVLSWISPAKRHAALDLIASRLAPGGLAYVSYNALPGWAAVEPLRRLMLDAGSTIEGDSLAKARHGVRVASLLSDADAGYFRSNPATRSILETMRKMGEHYVAHEYFHAHWVPMYFADVAREMAERGMYYVGQLPIPLNYRDLAVPASMTDLFKLVSNRIDFETLKDYALNEFFRRDVYIKGSASCSGDLTRDYLQSTPFTAVAGGAPLRRELQLPHHALHFTGPLFDALLPALEGSVATADELSHRPGLSDFGAQAIRDAMLRVILGDQVWPARAPVAPAPPPSPAARYRIPLAYNRMTVAELSDPIVLASPVLGSGVRISLIQAVCLRMLTEADAAGRAAWLTDFIARHPLRLHAGEQIVTDPGAQESLILREFSGFTAGRLAELVRLGVVERAGGLSAEQGAGPGQRKKGARAGPGAPLEPEKGKGQGRRSREKGGDAGSGGKRRGRVSGEEGGIGHRDTNGKNPTGGRQRSARGLQSVRLPGQRRQEKSAKDRGMAIAMAVLVVIRVESRSDRVPVLIGNGPWSARPSWFAPGSRGGARRSAGGLGEPNWLAHPGKFPRGM
jgi:SAM-dependent methyltransferase